MESKRLIKFLTPITAINAMFLRVDVERRTNQLNSKNRWLDQMKKTEMCAYRPLTIIPRYGHLVCRALFLMVSLNGQV